MAGLIFTRFAWEICHMVSGAEVRPLTMKRILMLALILVSLPLGVWARLGETERELVARFGKPLTRTDEITLAQGKRIAFGTALRFRQGDWSIECVIIEDRCAQEAYQKPGDWTEDQFRAILSSEAQGARWTDRSQEAVKKIRRDWRRGDGASAVWAAGIGMVVTHPAYGRAKERAEAKAKADASRVPRF